MENQPAHLNGISIYYICNGEMEEYTVYPHNIKTEVMQDERVVLYCTVLCGNCNQFHRFSFTEGVDFPL